MSRKLVLIILAVLVSGCIATLISGFYTSDLTHGVGAHVAGYGFPLSWLTKSTIVYPGNPTSYSLSLESLLLDTAFWSLIIGIPIAVLSRWFEMGNRADSKKGKKLNVTVFCEF